MFANLNERKLSSKFHDAHVFSYSGATVRGINDRFAVDGRKDKVDSSQVGKIVLMCGSNNIDSILDSPKCLRENITTQCTPNISALQQAYTDIEDLVQSLHNWAPNAKICVLNILPRESWARNDLISDINEFISKLPEKYSFLHMISSEKDRCLFSNKQGYRKSHYFSVKGNDNVHLNNRGVVRLANYLKHTIHHC